MISLHHSSTLAAISTRQQYFPKVLSLLQLIISYFSTALHTIGPRRHIENFGTGGDCLFSGGCTSSSQPIMYRAHYILQYLRPCSYGQKLPRFARKHFDEFTSEISPCYENNMKSYIVFIWDKTFPVYRDLAC